MTIGPYRVVLDGPTPMLTEVLRQVIEHHLDVRRTSVEWDEERHQMVLVEAREEELA